MGQVIVLGAGMVGVSTALALQDRGADVLLVDRNGIGRAASYGNGGAIQTEATAPYGFPRSVAMLARVALGRTPEVNWHLASMAEHLRPLLTYWWNSSPRSLDRIAASYRHLTMDSARWHAPLIEAAGAEHLIEANGYRTLFRSQRAFDAALPAARAVQDEFDVPMRVMSGAELAAAEPCLQMPLAGALHYHGVTTCRDPGGLTAAYGDLFQRRGGRFAAGDATTLRQQGAGWQVQTKDGLEQADRVVVALGAWSTQVTAPLGYRIPLFRKRGYHRHYATANGPRAALMDVERGVFIARMDRGTRLTTGAEFTGIDAAPDLRQIRLAEASTRELFDLGQPVEETPWFGPRPCLPDMLPVLGEAPRHKGLWLHFGHGHHGFTAGPGSAHILAELMSGNPLPVTRALTPKRFS